MEDLLNEDEFLIRKPEAAPWKYLAVYCFIAIVQVAVLKVIYAYFITIFNESLLLLTSFGLPPIMVFIMFFGRKKNRFLSKIDLATFILILLGTYFIAFLSVIFWNSGITLSPIVNHLSLLAGRFIVCFLILLPIASEKQKAIGNQ